MARLLLLVTILFLSSCVYTLDIQQGNILVQKDIDKLRPTLTKNQVIFVLGNPVVDDSFSDDEWVYLYTYKSRNQQKNSRKKLVLYFEKEALVAAEGDFDISEELQKKPKTELPQEPDNQSAEATDSNEPLEEH